MPRLDIVLVEKGIARSRETAKEYIKNGDILVNGKPELKPSFDIDDADEISFLGTAQKYVGRGGFKLEKAINAYSIDLNGLICADLGASTGGFTDCMLQNGAKKVYAVDVGHGQLAEKLLCDKRVINIEGLNVKNVSINSIGEECDFVAADLSFISVKFAQQAAMRVLKQNGLAVFLIKPQFEAGKSDISKGGIVKNKKAHERVLNDVVAFLIRIGFCVKALTFSPIQGGDGNIEYLVLVEKSSNLTTIDFNYQGLVNSAFEFMKKGG